MRNCGFASSLLKCTWQLGGKWSKWPLTTFRNHSAIGFAAISLHHGIRSTINHDPALAGLFKLFFFVRYIIHIHCPFMLCLAAQSPTGKRKIGIPTVNETVNEGANTHFSAGFPCHNP